MRTIWRYYLPLLLAICFALPAQSQTREVRIGILVDFLPPSIEYLIPELEREISAVVGNDARVVFPEEMLLINGFDSTLAERHYQTLLLENIDIIVAFGPVNSRTISSKESHQKPTILFGAVNRDLISFDETRQVSGINNFTYIVSSQSYEEDLQAFASLFDFRNLGVVTSNDESIEDFQFRDRLQEIVSGFGAQHRVISFESVDQLSTELQGLDAIYIAEGFGIEPDDIEGIAHLLIDRKLPSFTSTRRQDVELGLMATNVANEDFELLFRRIALGVEAVVDGRNLANQPISIQFNESLTVNFNTAKAIGVLPRYSQILTTDLVGDIDKLPYEQQYSIQDAIQVVLEKNLSLQSSMTDVEIAQLDVDNARTNYHPNLSLNSTSAYIDPDLAAISSGQAPEKSTNADLTLSQSLYSQSASARIGIQKQLLNAEWENFNATQLDLILEAASASIDLLTLKSLMEIELSNLEVTRRNLKVAQKNFDAGQSSKSDIFRFQSELANNMQSFISAIASYSQGGYRLNAFFNNPIGTSIDILDIPVEDGPFEGFGYAELREMLDSPRENRMLEDFLVQEALANAPEIKSIDYSLEANKIDKAQYGWRRFIPSVSAQAKYNELIDQSGVGVPVEGYFVEDDYSFGLTFSVPLYSQNTENVARRSAEAQRQKLAYNRAVTAQNIEVQVRNAVQEVTSKIAGIELSKVAEDAAGQSLELTESSYANGAATIAELIDAQNNYFQAQSASATAKYDFIREAITLERQVGHFYFLFPSLEQGTAFLDRMTAFISNYHSNR